MHDRELVSIELNHLVAAVVRGWRGLLFASLAGATLTTGFALARPPQFTASAVLKARSGALNLGSVGGIAAGLGLSMPLGGGGDPPQYFVSLAQSSGVLDRAVDEIAGRLRRDESGLDSLAGAFGVQAEDRAILREQVARSLRDRMQIRVDASTSTIVASLRHRDRSLARVVLESVLSSAVSAAGTIEQGEGARSVSALAPLVAGADSALAAAERELAQFRIRNRAGVQYPANQVELDRLARNVEQRQETFRALQRALTEAQIASAKELSPLTMISGVAVPVQPDPRRLLLWMVGGLLLGAASQLLLLTVKNVRVLS